MIWTAMATWFWRLVQAGSLLIAAAFPGCSEGDAPEAQAPVCVRLFDHMADAVLPEVDVPARTQSPVVTRFEFDSAPASLRPARAEGRSIEFFRSDVQRVAIDPAGGVTGGGLRLGPGFAADGHRAVLLVHASGLARIRVRGRVRLEDNPRAQASNSREVLRIVELDQEIDDPGQVEERVRRRLPTHRVSRRIDPSGWDRFDESFLSAPGTRRLELHLLHRADGAASVTRFDDVEVEVTGMSEPQVYALLRERYRPRDGQDAATPWRLRVPLIDREEREEVRDAVLLPPPATLSIPLQVPAADTRPRLRFHYGLLPEALASSGGGAHLRVRFTSAQGAVELVSRYFDPKTDPDRRGWQEELVDLGQVAGRRGSLEFQSFHAGEAPPDPAAPGDGGEAGAEVPQRSLLDAVLVATPRIEPEEQHPDAWNVLLIGVDTLRPDRMSAFGYERDTTPNLRRLAEESMRFAGARSQAPWTLPSFSSILTSLYPSVHGAGRGGHDEWTPIDPGTHSIAEVLARHGYETQGIVANGLISPEYGLDQGFDAYRWQWAMESVAGDAPAVARFVTEHTTTPWLVFWHIMDPHLPYATDDRFRKEFTAGDYAGRFLKGGDAEVPFHVLDPRPGRRWFTHEGPPPPPDLDPADRAFVHDYYDAEVAEMDAAVGRVLQELRASGQLERTVIAFIADHGEGLGDHDHYHHGYTLYDDQVRVPMLLRVPGRPGRTVPTPVAAIDLAPTLLGVLGIAPPEGFQGVDLLRNEAREPFFIEYPTYDSSAQKAWVHGPFKYLHDPLFRTQHLFHLERDPGEGTDVAAEFPEIVARARADLDAFRWQHLQHGRYHLRVRGAAGQRLTLRVATDDLFDANYAARPLLADEAVAMDLDRRTLQLDAALADGRLELVFWCRGRALTFDARLDGEPLGGGLRVGQEAGRALPAEVTAAEIETIPGTQVPAPHPGQAVLWLEPGLQSGPPVVPTPEELEVLRQLGYAR